VGRDCPADSGNLSPGVGGDLTLDKIATGVATDEVKRADQAMWLQLAVVSASSVAFYFQNLHFLLSVMSFKLRVLQVGKYYPPTRGGIETHLEMLCQGLHETVDLQVVVADLGNSEIREIVGGVSVRRLGTVVKLAGAPFCPGLGRAMREARADIVHLHVPHPTALLTWLLSGCRGKLVVTYHSDIIRQRVLGKLIGPLQDLAYARAAAILVASPGLVAGSPVLARHRTRCVLVPFGLDLASFDRIHPQAVAALRQRFPGPLVLAVGRLIYYKGFEFLVRSMSRLSTPATLLIIGEGPLRSKLEAEVVALGLTGRVHFLGNVPDTTPYYQACDLFVLPSVARSEAFGLVQLEAMACGKAVINTQIEGSGVPFVSRDGESGLTVPPADTDALTTALMRLLGDDALRSRFGRAGRQRVEEEFTSQRMVDRTLEVYRSVVDAPT
jgi:glycosyltransferase involved in cell wall biosynthesis